MNMFRNIFTVATLAFGLGLYFLPIDDWRWVTAFGDQALPWIEFLLKAQPFPTIVLVVISLALWMTRKQF